MTRTREIETVPLIKILGWFGGVIAGLVLLAVSGLTASISSHITEIEKRTTALEVSKATVDANYAAVKDALTKIEIKLDNIQTEMLLQRRK